VIPTKDRPATLERALSAVIAAARKLPGEPVEIIVVDDGDDERVAALVAGLEGSAPVALRYVARREYGGRGPGDARNAGVLRARGDVIAFTDDDTRCRDDWLARGVGRLRDEPAIAGVEGAVVPEPAADLDAVRARVVHNLQGGAFLTANLFLRREAMLQAGGFQRLWPGGWSPFREDSDLALRVRELVGPIPFDRELVVGHPIDEVTPRAHLRTAAFFLLDEPFRRAHPSSIPRLHKAPTARLRVRAGCVSLLALGLLAPHRTRRMAAALLLVTTAAQHAQVERDLRLAGERRSPLTMLRDAVRRAPRNVAWSVVAGAARAAGVVGVRTGIIARRPPLAALTEAPPAREAPDRAG
jgi:hypothetical protein